LVDAIFTAAGTGTSVGLNIGSGKNLKLVGDVIDTNGNELLKVTATTSAVNEVTLANAATGVAPTLTASGGDTNIGFKLVAKGTGEITAKVNGSDVFNASSNFGFKNRIINGAMVIDQRNAGASVTPSTGTYSVDRWRGYQNVASKFTMQQNAASVTPPTGFKNYLGMTSSSAYSATGTDLFLVGQFIEGYNVADLGWGAAGASSITLSFWVRSSLTGTFGGSLTNSAENRSYPFTYTISVANTWELKSVTVAGDTSGTWLTTTGSGLAVYFTLGIGTTYAGTAGAWAGAAYFGATGATSVVGTNGATFYITGVQLEKGSTATSFDYRPYGTELALCQRYFETSYDIVGLTYFDQSYWSGISASGATYYASVTFKVSKRTNSPTVTTFRLGESGFTTAAPTVGNATNVGFAANKVANSAQNTGNFVFAYYVSNEL
jgi:hypothetical protein